MALCVGQYLNTISILLDLAQDSNSATITDTHQRYQTSYTAPCNGIVSHGGPIWWSSGFCPPHTQKQTKIVSAFVLRLKTPKLSPGHAGIIMAQSVVPLVYICGYGSGKELLIEIIQQMLPNVYGCVDPSKHSHSW